MFTLIKMSLFINFLYQMNFIKILYFINSINFIKAKIIIKIEIHQNFRFVLIDFNEHFIKRMIIQINVIDFKVFIKFKYFIKCFEF